ncbi:cupin domain-containing protein [Candidatus Aerophobetes bacterium]|jgi:quercetin dioxygenase-like cupin family protein|uniref:Cupin domain-containing protein n=1 Tax=Aerophobetes bacterium TaxID=2030807 RepID=A0A523VX56_UNCAE|nr:MAG: cupin domain-containing protein [Candidatus Aerophobetes bacterium]
MVVKRKDYRKKKFRGFSFLLGAVGERMMVALMEFQKGDEVESHEHPNEQAGYCLSGRFELKVSDKEYVVELGDSYLIPGDTIHSCHFIQDSQMVEVFSPPRK